jgi:putative nucleotidyltransferase with HDIG domain/excisionase family DNA binding protein
MNSDPNNTFLTPAQAAKLLNVSLVTLKKFIRTGRLKTITTPGGHHRIYRNDLMLLAGRPLEESGGGKGMAADELLFDLTEHFMKIIESRQVFCKGHSSAVSRMAMAIGRRLELPEGSLRNVRLGAMLHDIGKFTISQQILNKPGKLTGTEYSAIKLHARAGREMLRSIKPFNCVADIISQHHERFDGSGYPFGLRGERISVEARIITLADSFDAMTSSTSYKKALTTEGAFRELQSNAGTQFDPGIVHVFLNIYKNT